MLLTQDDLIKNVLLQPRLLKKFLIAFLPEVFEFADFQVLEYLDKEHPQSGHKPRRSGDLLIKVKWKNQVGMFLIHVESQGQAQDDILLRAGEYSLRDSIRYRLPVMPMVLLTYPGQRKEVANRLKWDFGTVAHLHLKCPIIHFQLMDPEPFLKSKNVCALALASVMNLSPDQRVDAIVETLTEIVKQRLTPAEEQALVDFAVMIRELNDTQKLQLDQKVLTLTKNNNRLSRMPQLLNVFEEIGKMKGRKEGEQAIILRLFAKKFPNLQKRAAAKVKRFDEETLLSFSDALLFMQTENDCKAWLKEHSNS